MAARLVSTEPATGAEIWAGTVGDPATEVAAARTAWPEWAAHSIAYRIEALAEVKNKMRVLDLQDEGVRAGVLASDKAPLELYDSDLAVDYDPARV